MRKKQFILCLFALHAAVTLLLWLEPWAERFERRTVTSWLREFAANQKVDINVVNGFGARAVPRLIRLIEREQRWNDWFQEFSAGETLRSMGFRDDSDSRASHQRAIAAGTWLSMLKAQQPNLQTDHWNPSVHRWLDIWDDTFWAPKWVQLVITTPHESAAARDLAARPVSSPAQVNE
ncbi:MAG TPA: hypothetical protein VF773_03755 [Verrucomicrobiae bacterium]